MKSWTKFLLTMSILIGSSSFAVCASFGDLLTDVKTETKVTLFESATPAYYYDLEEQDTSLRSKAGVATTIIKYRFITADAGWVTGIDASKKGAVVLGGSVHIDQLITTFLPNVSLKVKESLPDSSKKFWDKLAIGFFTSHDFDRQRFGYGFYSGLELKFR